MCFRSEDFIIKQSLQFIYSMATGTMVMEMDKWVAFRKKVTSFAATARI